MRQNFKFGRTYDVSKFILFDLEDYDMAFLRPSAYYSPQGTSGTSGSSGDNIHPQKSLDGIKKYHFKGKFPRPRNT